MWMCQSSTRWMLVQRLWQRLAQPRHRPCCEPTFPLYISNIPETHITFIISYPMFSPWFFSASLPRVHQPLSHMSAPLRHVVESMCSRSFATVCSPLSMTWGRTFKMKLRIGLCLSHFLSSKFKCQTHFNFWARAFQTQSNALQPASHIGRLLPLKEISIPWRRSTTCVRNIWLKVRPLTSTKSGLACKQFFKNVAGPIMFAKKPGLLWSLCCG